MIQDANGNELTYWPISGLIEGNNSGVLIFTVPTPIDNGFITATPDNRVNVWCRRSGIGSYVDISHGGVIDLSILSGDVNFQIYVEVVGPIVGLERIPITVVAGTSSSAGWVD